MNLEDRDYTLILTDEEQKAYDEEVAYEKKEVRKIIGNFLVFLIRMKKSENLFGIKGLISLIFFYILKNIKATILRKKLMLFTI